MSNLRTQPLDDYGTSYTVICYLYPVDMRAPQLLLRSNAGCLGITAKVAQRVAKFTHTNFARARQQIV